MPVIDNLLFLNQLKEMIFPQKNIPDGRIYHGTAACEADMPPSEHATNQATVPCFIKCWLTYADCDTQCILIEIQCTCNTNDEMVVILIVATRIATSFMMLLCNFYNDTERDRYKLSLLF